MGYTKTIYRRHLAAHDYNTGSHKCLCVVDKKAAGTQGGASAAATWNVRDLSEIVFDVAGKASLDTNKISLPAGKYRVDVKAPAFGAVGTHRLRLFNVTANAEVPGMVAQPVVGLAALQTFAELHGMFELTEVSEIRVDHYTELAVADEGLGSPSNVESKDEFYTVVNIVMESDPAAETMV